MALHTDIPTRTEIERLLSAHGAACVSIYLPTSPVTEEAEGERIAFRDLAASALVELREGGTPTDDVAAIEEALDDLHDDDDFWARQANSLAVFATPAGVRTFRLPNHLVELVRVSDRFHVKPLLRAVSFPQAAFVLALAQGSVRLVEVAASVPAHDVRVPDMPQDLESSVGKEAITDRVPRGRVGAEGQKVRMRQYARLVDHALRLVLTGLDRPLILASTEPLDGIFRSVNSYPHLAEAGIPGNPEEVSDEDLAAAARGVLDELYAAELAALRELFESRTSQGRGAIELSDVGRAATYGAIDTVLVDIDVDLPGAVDEESGVVTLDGDEAGEYGVIDEIARRVLLSGGRVVAVRADDIPGGGPTAAILRYAV